MPSLTDIRRRLRTFHPDVVQLVLIVNVLAFGLSILVSRQLAADPGITGESHPTTEALLLCGANIPHHVLVRGELYRLVTACILHVSLIHLGMNCLAIWVLGRPTQAHLGPARFFSLYVTTGIVASVVSTLWRGRGWLLGSAPSIDFYTAGVGASGAAMGIMGYLLGYLRGATDVVSRSLRSQLMFWLIVNVVFGLTNRAIDNAAHFGGFAAGFAFAVVLNHPRWHRSRRFIGSPALTATLLVIVLVAVGVAATREVGSWGRDVRAALALRGPFNHTLSQLLLEDTKGIERTLRRTRELAHQPAMNGRERPLAAYLELGLALARHQPVPREEQARTKQELAETSNELFDLLGAVWWTAPAAADPW